MKNELQLTGFLKRISIFLIIASTVVFAFIPGIVTAEIVNPYNSTVYPAPAPYATPYSTPYYYQTPYNYQTFYPAPYYYSTPYQQTSNQPSVTTNNASNITSSSATLNGSVRGNGLNTVAWFVYGTSTNFAHNTTQNSYGSGFSYYSALISGLAPNTIYYFRAVAQGPQGLVYGNTLSFNTTGNFVNVVNSQPTVVLSADDTSLSYNGATTIRWYTTGATSCNASDGSVGWAGIKSIGPGSFYTGSLTASRTYTITCGNNIGSDSDSVTVTVRGQTTTTTNPTPVSSSAPIAPSSESGETDVLLGANVFGAGFLPANLFEWLLLLVLILVLALLAKYLFDQSRNQRDQRTTITPQ